MTGIAITHHAYLRLREMGLEPEDVAAVVLDPEVDYPSDADSYGEGARTAQRGEVAVGYVIEGESIVVQTVLPRTQEEYKR